MREPGAVLAMLRLQPERLDRRAKRQVGPKWFEHRAQVGVPLQQRDRVQPDGEPELAEGETSRRGPPGMVLLGMAPKAFARRLEQGAEQIGFPEWPLSPELRDPAGIHEQSADAQ